MPVQKDDAEIIFPYMKMADPLFCRKVIYLYRYFPENGSGTQKFYKDFRFPVIFYAPADYFRRESNRIGTESALGIPDLYPCFHSDHKIGKKSAKF